MIKKVEPEDGSHRAVTRMLIRDKGRVRVDIHIFMFSPTSFFSIMKFRLVKRKPVPNMGPKDVSLLGYRKMRKDDGKILRERWT